MTAPTTTAAARRREALDTPTRHTLDFVRAHLPDRGARLLEVGCGDGRLAAALQRRGVRVLALDQSAAAVRAARARGVTCVRADFLAFEHAPFDVLLFTRSLHHLQPLDEAVARARRLLVPGGRLLVEDFQNERGAALFVGWQDEHEHVSDARELRRALRREFVLERQERVPYLYRYPLERLRAPAPALGRGLLAAERRLIAAGALPAIGLRLVGRPRRA